MSSMYHVLDRHDPTQALASDLVTQPSGSQFMGEWMPPGRDEAVVTDRTADWAVRARI